MISIRNLVRFCSYKTIRRPNLKAVKTAKVQSLENKADKSVSLPDSIQLQIKTTGPITVADYMRKVLTSPNSGYYMTKDVFGKEGDFITSPEIHQIFGELVAVWCMHEYEKLGSPTAFQLVELGPGRGTLSQDILRVLGQFKFGDNLSLHLVEISPYLAKIQASRLCYRYQEVSDPQSSVYQHGETISGIKVFWYRQLKDVPKDFSMFIAHEFFDALPVHKLQKSDSGVWKEILVDIDPGKNAYQFRFVTARSETPISNFVASLFPKTETRNHLEYSPDSQSVLLEITDRLESDGGFGLIMDYGHVGEKGDTFRAFKNHQLHDPLVDPGSADLTADVDFCQFARFIEMDEKCIHFGPVSQHDFIKRLGGDTRIEVLFEKAAVEHKDALRSGYKMLTDKNQMGERFKFFSFYPKVLKDHLERFPPTGFHPE